MSEHAYKIEKGIPVPTPTINHGITDALRELQPGDSFLIPVKHSRTGLYVMARNVGIRITVRTEADGYRIWRIA